MKDPIGDRIKSFYESRTKYFVPRRTFTIIRIDGKAFHTFTRGLKRPFDEKLTDWMNRTTQMLCKEIQGVKFGYVQSDEISLVLTDFDTITTDAWFGGNIQKMASISASIATYWFNYFKLQDYFCNDSDDDTSPMIREHFEDGYVAHDTPIRAGKMINYLPLQSGVHGRPAMFDSRVFTIPSEDEVINYFYWRQLDCMRNSVSSVAQSLFSSKELHGKSTEDMKQMILDSGKSWDEFDDGYKYGRLITKERQEYKRWVNIEGEDVQRTYTRNEWTVSPAPIFVDYKSQLSNILIPNR